MSDDSLRSSFSGSGVEPTQLEEQPQPSRLRRLSNATSSLFRPQSRVSVGRTDTHEHVNGLHEWDFGADGLAHSVKRPTDEESAKEPLEEASEEESLDSEADSGVVPLVAPLGTEGAPEQPPVRRRSTVASALGSFSKKLGFWDRGLKNTRTKIVVTVLSNFVYLLVGFAVALCIYWGAYYDRPKHYGNIKFAVVDADAQVGELTPVLGEFVTGFFTNPKISAYGNFDVWDYSRIADAAAARNSSIFAEVRRMVHHQKYHAAFYVHENATALMYQHLETANGSLSPATDLMTVYYETGSDYNAMFNGVVGIISVLTRTFSTSMGTGPWSSFWFSVLNTTQLENNIDNNMLLYELPNFTTVDGLPVVKQVVQAPLQIGLIYLCTFTFFQFLFALPIHMSVVGKLKGLPFIFFRIMTSHFSYFILGLSFVLLNTAFGISFNTTFGQSGFLVLWAIAYLTMASIGSLIEVLILLCFTFKPPMMGVVLLFIAVINLAPTISPIYLCPTFYRYGYAMPVYNAYHLLQVAYFNAWKGNMGRYFGILAAWVVCTTALLPFVLKFVSKKMEERKAAEAAAAAAKNTQPLSLSPEPSAHEQDGKSTSNGDDDSDRFPLKLAVRDHRQEDIVRNAHQSPE